jgi:hypothetical protein
VCVFIESGNNSTGTWQKGWRTEDTRLSLDIEYDHEYDHMFVIIDIESPLQSPALYLDFVASACGASSGRNGNLARLYVRQSPDTDAVRLRSDTGIPYSRAIFSPTE